MSIDISKDIWGLKGQRVNKIKREDQPLIIHCSRDKRRRAVFAYRNLLALHIPPYWTSRPAQPIFHHMPFL